MTTPAIGTIDVNCRDHGRHLFFSAIVVRRVNLYIHQSSRQVHTAIFFQKQESLLTNKLSDKTFTLVRDFTFLVSMGEFGCLDHAAPSTSPTLVPSVALIKKKRSRVGMMVLALSKTIVNGNSSARESRSALVKTNQVLPSPP